MMFKPAQVRVVLHGHIHKTGTEMKELKSEGDLFPDMKLISVRTIELYICLCVTM